ncbi:hypothetical protein SprV_0200580400 [Sparganum proliferum]
MAIVQKPKNKLPPKSHLIVWMLFNIASAAIFMLVACFAWCSFFVHTFMLLVVFFDMTWNAACYYIDYFATLALRKAIAEGTIPDPKAKTGSGDDRAAAGNDDDDDSEDELDGDEIEVGDQGSVEYDIEESVETIELLLREKYDDAENRLGHAQIIQLLKFCLKTYFTPDGTIYEQVKGTPRGSPISGLIAETVLQRLESLVLRHHRPKFWARYVDDTFVVIERDQVLTFQEHLNAVFSDVQFTMEEGEENNQLAFLDVLVCRKDSSGLKTNVFRKATNTTQILNFNSNHPISHKRSCVRTLYRRVETHCSERKTRLLNYNIFDG